MKSPYNYYLIHSGPLLEIAQAYQAEYLEAHQALIKLLKKWGNIRAFKEHEGRVLRVRFEGEPPEGFTKPDRQGFCYPKKGSHWHQAYQAQKGCPEPIVLIKQALLWDNHLTYTQGSLTGSASLNPIDPCGIVWNEFQAFGLYISDVKSAVQALTEQGFTVQEPAASSTMRFKGCKKIKKSLFYGKFQ